MAPLRCVEQRGVVGRGTGLEGKGESRPLVVGSGRTAVVLAIRCAAPKL